MRIAHFYGHGGANGVTSIAADLIAGLRERGHSVSVLCRSDSVLAKVSTGCTTYHWLPGNLHHAGLRARLRTLLEQDAIEVLHVHSFRDAGLALTVAHNAGVPSCYTVHGLDQASAAPARWATLVIADSEGVAHFLRKECLIGPAQLVTIATGIDEGILPVVTRAEARQRWGYADEDIVFGFVGRLTSTKNVEALVTACARLAVKMPLLRLLMIGDGPRARAVRRSAAKLGFASRLTMPGWLPRADTLEAVAALDVFVLPSLRGEGLSIALLEAMALGVPVLASDLPSLVGGPVRHGETGWLFRPGTEDNLREAIRGILALPESSRQKIGAAAAAEVRAHYTLSGVVDQVEKVYEALVV